MLTDLATVKAWLGITDTTYDTQLTALIAGVDDQVKRYCNRNFETGTVVAKFNLQNNNEIVLDETPVTAVLYAGAGTQGAITISKAGANASAFFKTAKVGVSTLHLVSGMTDTQVAVNVTDTMDDLVANIVLEGWTAAVVSGYGEWPAHSLIDQETGDSESGQDITLFASLRPVVLKRTDTEGVYRFSLQDDGWGDWCVGGYYSGSMIVVYTGGYATVPAGLSLLVNQICCNAWRNFASNAAMKSEKVGDYAYTKFDSAETASSIGPFMTALDLWRRA